jgi:hypothetical protein
MYKLTHVISLLSFDTSALFACHLSVFEIVPWVLVVFGRIVVYAESNATFLNKAY